MKFSEVYRKQTRKGLTCFPLLFSVILTVIISTSCTNNNENDAPDAPPKISYFLTQYFPGRAIESLKELPGGNYAATVKNGPVITFDSEGNWFNIEGDGETLPEVLLFDQLPPELYEYIQGLESTDEVFSLTRTGDSYTAVLLNTTVKYDSATGKVTEI